MRMINGHGDDLYRYDNIRMNFSSNIFSHADLSGLKKHLAERMEVIGSYPEPEPYTLEQMLAERMGISADCVMVTNGATEAIYLIAQAFSNCRPVVHEPTFSEYASATKTCGGERELHFICNPNNPTGRVETPTMNPHALYVIDQAYENYTLKPLLKDTETTESNNVMLLHSMTKQYCIPGLRLGYVTASKHIISQLREHRQPWSVNALAIEAGMYLLENGIPNFPDLHEYLGETKRLARELNAIEGVEMTYSDTTFMLGTIKQITAAEFKERLAREHGILIRDASNFTGLTSHHFRVATQDRHENDTLVKAIKMIIDTTI